MMVRVFKCHSFASQHVIQIDREPLTICAGDDKVFVATSDCEIIVFRVIGGASKEIQRCPTISQVDQIEYNTCKNYIATVELKKSWKKLTKSVRVYLNWDASTQDDTKPRTKVRVAGKSHVQHMSTMSNSSLMEIIEVPTDGNATNLAVCRYTGNFAVSCGREVKLCSVVEKTVANSDKTYLDVEVFLELCWSFLVQSMSLCEEFVVCCSSKEVQGIRVRYDELEKISMRTHRKLQISPSTSVAGNFGNLSSSQDPLDCSRVSSKNASPQSNVSETIMFSGPHQVRGAMTVSPHRDVEGPVFSSHYRNTTESIALKDFSLVGMRPNMKQSPRPVVSTPVQAVEANIIDDEHLVEWNFQQRGNAAGGAAICLPGLHTSSTQSQCIHHAHVISPPVLSDFSGGKVKSSSGVHAETVLHLNDVGEKEDWMNVVLIPTHNGVPTIPIQVSSVTTDRMKSLSSSTRTSMCCYISGNRGGYLYQLSPLLTQISSYKYTDKAIQIGVSQSHLHVVTNTGIETYTSRWGAVSLEMSEKEEDDPSSGHIHPPPNLEICLCGHEPFLGAVNLSVGTDFLALLSKVDDLSGSNEAHWSLYILHSFSLVDMYKDMICFAQRIQTTGPASYIHLLQEAHLLLSTHPVYTVLRDVEVTECLHQVCRLLGDYYAQLGQEDWKLCWPYYKTAGASVQSIVKTAVLGEAVKQSPREFGKGLLHFLDNMLFSQEEYMNLSQSTSDTILNIYAVAAPEKLSRVILLSNLKAFSAETAFHHLRTWLSLKSSASQPISAIDKLAIVQLQLTLCEVESACSELESIEKANLIDVCSSYPALMHVGLRTFTPLAQLMRQHMSSTLLEILVEMLDRDVMSLYALLMLLKSPSQLDVSCNSHTKEVLELILSDEKRSFLFQEAAQILCEIYIARIKDKSEPNLRQMSALAHQKFSLGNGHFAPRFGWLDYLAPFYGPSKMTKPCQLLEVKQVPGHGSRGSSLPLAVVTKQHLREKCPCCMCNESLLKLQSLLCSPHLTAELAKCVLQHSENHESPDQENISGDEYWVTIKLLCLTKLDIERTTEKIVHGFPSIVGLFAACCFHGELERYMHLLHIMETVMKSCIVTALTEREEVYVKAYKDLLSRMTELFSPAHLLELLPADGNLYFLLPLLDRSLSMEHTDELKKTIVEMGSDLMIQN